jgi:hypothetical protein
MTSYDINLNVLHNNIFYLLYQDRFPFIYNLTFAGTAQ